MVSAVVVIVSANVALKLLLSSETNAVERESTWVVLTSFDSIIPPVAADWVTFVRSVCSALVAIVLGISSCVWDVVCSAVVLALMSFCVAESSVS